MNVVLVVAGMCLAPAASVAATPFTACAVLQDADKQRSILLQGRVEKNGDRVTLDVPLIGERRADYDRSMEGDPAKDPQDRRWYAFEFLDGEGRSLQSINLCLTFGHMEERIGEGGGFVPDDETVFSYTLPFPEKAQRFVIKRRGKIVAHLDRSPNPPVVTFRRIEKAATKRRIKWELKDADQNRIAFLMFLRTGPDGSAWSDAGTFDPRTGTIERVVEEKGPFLEKDPADPFSFTLDVAELTGDEDSCIEVIACDGLNGVTMRSEKLDLPRKAGVSGKKGYRARIRTPKDGDTFEEFDTVSFLGEASRFDGSRWHEDDSLKGEWTSDLAGPLELRHVWRHYLPPGRHRITLSVRDGKGEVIASTSVTITVDLKSQEWDLLEGPDPSFAAWQAIEIFIAKLGDDSPEEREYAAVELRRMGDVAINALQSARRAKDAQTKALAEQLFEELKWKVRLRKPPRVSPHLIEKIKKAASKDAEYLDHFVQTYKQAGVQGFAEVLKQEELRDPLKFPLIRVFGQKAYDDFVK